MRKRKSLEELLGERITASYSEQYEYITSLLDTKKIKPVLAAGKNGKKPALYLSYWEEDKQKDYSALLPELLYNLEPKIDISYYQQNLSTYAVEREDVLQLNDFFRQHAALLATQVSYNERSFQIWAREKFLLKGEGKKILKHCGLELSDLNCYSTAEPFAYFSLTREVPQKLLIIENKDTFFSLRKFLLAGNKLLFGEKISTLIYGAGKRVISSFQEFATSAEPYMLDEANELLYFGDLDYEGIGIYENLAESFAQQGAIKPFKAAYLAMLAKSEEYKKLPATKEEQNKQLKGGFFTYFTAQEAEAMQKILQQDLYIPQEILSLADF